MRPLFHAGALAATRVPDEEAGRFQPLLERCDDFFLRCFGRPAREDEARRMPLERPGGVTPERGHLLALEDASGAWVGILEGIQDFPAPGEWYLGLMLLAPQARGAGRGAAAFRGYEDWVRAEGARVLRVGVAEPNPDARRFWERMGFEAEAWVGPLAQGTLTYRVLRMRRTLAPGATSR